MPRIKHRHVSTHATLWRIFFARSEERVDTPSHPAIVSPFMSMLYPTNGDFNVCCSWSTPVDRLKQKSTERTWCPLSFPFSGAPSSPFKVRWLLHHSICCTRYFKSRARNGDLSDGLSNYLHRSGAFVDAGARTHCKGRHRDKCASFRPPMDGCRGLFCNRLWAQVHDLWRTIPQVGARRKIPVLPSGYIEVRTGRCHRQQPGQSASLQLLMQEFAARVFSWDSCQRSPITFNV